MSSITFKWQGQLIFFYKHSLKFQNLVLNNLRLSEINLCKMENIVTIDRNENI